MKFDASDKLTDNLIIRGSFTGRGGVPIAGASVHQRFLGDPPRNCGTCFGLNEAPAYTDELGQFQFVVPDDLKAPGYGSEAWPAGSFLVVAVKDSRTLGFSIATGRELASSPVSIAALETVDIQGTVIDQAGHPVQAANVAIGIYNLHTGMEKFPVNFWLYTGSWKTGMSQVADLTALTNHAGEFRIPQCPAIPGKFGLVVSHPDFATLEVDYAFTNSELLVMDRGGLIRLVVTLPNGTPATKYEFCLEGEPDGQQNNIHRFGTTDEQGRCEFAHLPAGHYVVRYMGGGGEPWACCAIDVPNLWKGEQRELSVKAVSGSVLSGQVLDETTNEPLPDAEIRFESAHYPATGSTFQAAYTRADGTFEFPFPVAPGELDICISYAERMVKRCKAVISTAHKTELAFTI